MKANELRIGNLVKDPYGETIKLVSVERDASMLRPIELTEEWLVKFGFKRNGSYIYAPMVNNYSLGIYKSDNGYRFAISNWNSISIMYIHQLQNLYFSLTNEELTIT
jgi:hypothetical protein